MERPVIWSRRFLSLLVLVQLALWLHQFAYFFSDLGPLSRVVVLQCVPASGQGISAHMLSGSLVFQAVLFALALAAALFMGSRRYGRRACALSWFLLLSAMHRAPHASGSGTMLLSLGLLWCALLKDNDDLRGRPVGLGLLLQMCLSAGLCARLGPVPEALGWLGLLAPWLLWTRNPRWVKAGMGLTALFYLLALGYGLGPLIGAVGLALLPAAWPVRAATADPLKARDVAAVLLVILSLGATSARLWRTSFPRDAWPLVQAFALQQAQEFHRGSVPYFETRLYFSDGSWLSWSETDWLRRRHLMRLRGNPVLIRPYLAYRLRQSPKAGALRLELLRVGPSGKVVEGNWTVQSGP